MILTSGRAFAGLLLCALLLGATWPTLSTMPALPARVLAGDAYVVTQGSGSPSINDSLAQSLASQPWADVVSPEMLAFGSIRGIPVVLRAAKSDTFLAMEGGRWLALDASSARGAYAGEGLARRLGLTLGDYVSLVGSTVPRIEIARVRGLFVVEGPASDELVVDYGLGRSLTGLGLGRYHSIRVRTPDPAALVAFLSDFGSSAHVSGPYLPRVDVHSDPPDDDRLTNLLLRSGRGPVPRDVLTIAVAEATNSVRVVAYGLALLIGLMVAMGVHAVQARAFADKRGNVGVLRTVGASGRWLRARVVLETLPTALGAAILGAVLGVLLDALVRPTSAFLLFGHEVRAQLDFLVLLGIIASLVGISIASALILLEGALRSRPMESIREEVGVETPPALEVVLRS